jgi:hypothetical protein
VFVGTLCFWAILYPESAVFSNSASGALHVRETTLPAPMYNLPSTLSLDLIYLPSISLLSHMGMRQQNVTALRKTRQRKLTLFAAETEGGAGGPGLAGTDSARIQARFKLAHPIILCHFTIA